jgi:hypothetical protein
MPAGAVLAGPIAAAVGVSATQYGAAALIVLASLLALVPRDIWRLRSGEVTELDAGSRPATSRSEALTAA